MRNSFLKEIWFITRYWVVLEKKNVDVKEAGAGKKQNSLTV